MLKSRTNCSSQKHKKVKFTDTASYITDQPIQRELFERPGYQPKSILRTLDKSSTEENKLNGHIMSFVKPTFFMAENLKEQCHYEMVEAQKLCTEIKPVMDMIEKGLLSSEDNTDEYYFYSCDLEDNLLVDHTMGKARVVLPSQFREEALLTAHEIAKHKPHAGTDEMKRTLKNVSWKEMDNDIEKYVENCKTCQTLQEAVQKAENQMSLERNVLEWQKYGLPHGPYGNHCQKGN